MPRLISIALLSAVGVTTPDAAQIAGETHRTTTIASAAVRDAEHRPTLRVTVWYPAAKGAEATSLSIGDPTSPLFTVGAAAADVPILPSSAKRPVVLLSHGFGGSARMMGWFGTAMAEAGYVVISVDHPGNNGVDTMTVPGAILPWERAEDLKQALKAVGEDPVLGPHLDLTRIGAAGFSAGGFTALVLGGATVDVGRLERFCHASPSDGVCRPQLEFAVTEAESKRAQSEPAVAALIATASADHSMPGVKAVFVMAPAIVQALRPDGLEAIRKLVAIIVGDHDIVAPPATNANIAAAAIPGARLTTLGGATHYSFLSKCTPAGVAVVPLCKAVGAQEEAHRIAIEQAKALFARMPSTSLSPVR
jgi:predicted dienelactone hydrolase